MSNGDKNKGGQQPPIQPATQRKDLNVATQKTFKFKRGTPTDKMDDVVNKWLLEIAKIGSPAMLGKTYSNIFGTVFIQYLYTRKFQVVVPIAPTTPGKQ